MSNSRWSKFISNFDQNSAFFSLVLALMSFCAIIVSLMTLREMQTQRELSLMPIIYPQNFKTIKLKSDSICDTTIYHYQIEGTMKEGDSLVQKPYQDWLKLGFINVGKGSAVNIKFIWDLNYGYFANSFDTIQVEPWKFEFKKTEIRDKNFMLRFFNCKTGTSSIFNNEYSISYTHLLPAADTDEDFYIKIPPTLIALHIARYRSLWLKYGQTETNTTGFSVKNHLNLQYESVNGNKFNTNYEVEIDLYPPLVSYGQEGIYASWENFELGMNLKQL